MEVVRCGVTALAECCIMLVWMYPLSFWTAWAPGLPSVISAKDIALVRTEQVRVRASLITEHLNFISLVH